MLSINAPFPLKRSRRLRRTEWIRAMVTETQITTADLIWPIFVCEGSKIKKPIVSLPNINRLSVDLALEAAKEAYDHGIPCIALFPHTPENLKNPECSEAWNSQNLVNSATRLIKKQLPDLGIILDVALDPYNSLGHDGLVKGNEILNDETLLALEKQALVQAQSGADILGPSDMMDGRIKTIREALESNGFYNTAIMSYAAKFASSFYGPFRDAVGASSALQGDKKTYQINNANLNEAIREVESDITEGADMVMVKPGMPYLDVCKTIKDTFNIPTFAYQVSGEYAMMEGAIINGWIDGDLAILESLTSFKRAGCDGILTYFALRAAKLLN